MQHYGHKYACRPPNPEDGVNKSKFNFFRAWFMLHIKLNEITKCSNIVANILSADPLPWGQKVNIQFFQNMIMLHISNLLESRNVATC